MTESTQKGGLSFSLGTIVSPRAGSVLDYTPLKHVMDTFVYARGAGLGRIRGFINRTCIVGEKLAVSTVQRHSYDIDNTNPGRCYAHSVSTASI